MCYNQNMGKPYTLLEVREDGTEVRQYEDGNIRNQRGQLLVLPENAPVITSENARQYHQMRKDKILRAIESRIQDVTKTNAPAEAIAAIVGKRASIAMKDETRTGNEAAKIVLSAVDAYQDKRDGDHQTTTRHEYAIDDDTKALLHAMLRQRRDGEVIDVEANTMRNDDDGDDREI